MKRKNSVVLVKVNLALLGLALIGPPLYGLLGENRALYYGLPEPSCIEGIAVITGLAVLLLNFADIILGLIKERKLQSPWLHMVLFPAALFVMWSNLPPQGVARERARRISCQTNLKQLALALQQYAMDYHGWYPPPDGVAGLEILRQKEYLADSRIYLCPSVSTPAVSTPAGEDGPPLTENTVSYHYYGGGRIDSPPARIVARDKDDNHFYYGNVLYADGKVTEVQHQDWARHIPSRSDRSRTPRTGKETPETNRPGAAGI